MLVSVDGWAILDGLEPEVRAPIDDASGRVVGDLVGHGLVEVRQDAGGWSAMLTQDGVDALAFRATRSAPCPRWVEKQKDEAFRALALTPGEVDLLRVALRLTLRPGGVDLSDVVSEAHHDTATNRWILQVSATEANEVGRVVWLDALSGNVAARNRLAWAQGVKYPPAS